MKEKIVKCKRLKVDDYLDDFLSIYKTSLNTDEFLTLLREYGLERLYIEEFSVCNDEFFDIANKIDAQNKKNNITENEIIELTNKFNKANIPLVTFKGVTLAYEIYNENPGMRRSRDIDVFVAPKDIETALDILGDNGYYVWDTGEKATRCLCERYQNKMLSSIHFPVFGKKFLVNDEIIEIPMDCHISILHMVEDRDVLMNQMIERAEPIRLGENTVRVLELHDRILHLITHMMKEYFRNVIRWNINGEKQIYKGLRFPLNLLHEIARMIELNNERIDWVLLVNLAQKYFINDEFWGAIKLLNNVYPYLIPQTIINNAYENVKGYDENSLGQYYALSIIRRYGADILKQSLDEISANVIHDLLEETEYKIGERYLLSNKHSNPFVHGCEIINNKNNNVVAEISVTYTDKHLVVQLANGNSFVGKRIVLTVSFGTKNEFSKAFIDRFICDIEDCNLYGDTSLYICNAHVDAVLKECVHVTDNMVTIKVPTSWIGNSNMDKKEILIDVDLPDLFELYDAGVPKYKANTFHSVSTYMHNPCLLKKFVI